MFVRGVRHSKVLRLDIAKGLKIMEPVTHLIAQFVPPPEFSDRKFPRPGDPVLAVGIKKNLAQMHTLFALANVFRVRQQLMTT
jgi:hypothetical protein